MDMFSSFFITPLTAIFDVLYTFSLSVTRSYGSALLLLSVLTSILMFPLGKWASKYVITEKRMQSILAPQIAHINNTYKGKEKNSALSRLYKRYSYSPIYSFRLSLNILIQLPFLFGAYCFLDSYSELKNISFFIFKDLSVSDGLLLGINVMPFIMTIVNVAVAYLSPNFSKRDYIQAYVIALLFLFILYTASSALLIYWTCNNVVSLVKVLYQRNKLRLKNILNKFIQRYKNNAVHDFYKNNWKWLIVLSSLSPACLLWLKNIEFFGVNSIVKAVFLLVLISSALIFVINLFKRFIKSDVVRVIFITFTLLLSVTLFYWASKESLFIKPKQVCLIIAVVLVLFLIGKIKILNVLLSLVLAVELISGTSNFLMSEYSSKMNISSNQIDTSIKLKKTPNIYYILCESMNSLDIANSVYGVPQKELDDFKSYMKQKGFVIPENVYSNGASTLETMYFISIMNAKPSRAVGNLDLSVSQKNVIAGNKNNNLLRIFKFNNYHVTHLLYGYDYYPKKGRLVDYTDVKGGSIESEPLMHIHGLIGVLEKNYLFRKMNFTMNKDDNIAPQDPLDAINWYFNQERNKSTFLFQRMAYTNHSPSDGSYTCKNSSEWLKSEWYKNAYVKQLESIKKETDIILEHDPNAIIIFLGDHGAYLYRCFVVLKTKDAFNKLLDENGITKKQYFDDKFKVFGAVRIPKEIGEIDSDFSSVNVFSKIFNMIGSEDGRLFPIAKNDSYFAGELVNMDQ